MNVCKLSFWTTCFANCRSGQQFCTESEQKATLTSEWPFPQSLNGYFQCPKQKSEATFMNQIYHKLVEKIAPETNSGHWKVVFLPWAVRKILLFPFPCDAERDNERALEVYVKCVGLFKHVFKFITFMPFVMLRGTMREVSNLLVWGNFANYTSCVSQLPAFSSIKRRWGKVLKRLKLNCFERNIIISRDVIWDNLRPKL